MLLSAWISAVADHFIPFFDLADPADIQADRSIELQCISTRRGFGVSEHHTDLFAELVDEDHAALGLADGAGKFSHCLRHEARMRSEEHTSELQSRLHLVCRLLLEK